MSIPKKVFVVLLVGSFAGLLHAGLLHEHAKAGDLEVVGQLLDAGAPINEPDEQEGLTALHYASRHGHLELVKLLVAKGADIKTKGTLAFRSLPFHSACEGAQKEVVDYFVSEHKIDPKTEVILRGRGLAGLVRHKLNGVQMALLYFDRHFDGGQEGSFFDRERLYGFVRYLAEEKGVEVPKAMPFEQQANLKMTLPMVAARIGAASLLQYLVDEKKRPLANPKNRTEEFPQVIHMAAQSGNLETVKYLVSKGESLDSHYLLEGDEGTDERMYTIHFAAYARDKQGAVDIIQYLFSEMSIETSVLESLLPILERRKNQRALSLVESELKKRGGSPPK